MPQDPAEDVRHHSEYDLSECPAAPGLVRQVRPQWFPYVTLGFSLIVTSAGWISSGIRSAQENHEQFLQLSDQQSQLAATVSAHTKQMSALQDEVSQARTNEAVLLEKTDNISKTVDRIEQALIRKGKP